MAGGAGWLVIIGGMSALTSTFQRRPGLVAEDSAVASPEETVSAGPMADPEPPSDFGRFYRATLAPLRRYLGRFTRNHAEAQDLAHDAYARVYPVIQKGNVEQPQALLYTTARNLAINQIKRRSIAPMQNLDATALDAKPASAPGVVQTVMARQEWSQLETAIAALPPGCRSVLLLRKVELLSHEEIGRRLNISVSTVEKQHARALRLLREALAPLQDQPTSNAPSTADSDRTSS